MGDEANSTAELGSLGFKTSPGLTALANGASVTIFGSGTDGVRVVIQDGDKRGDAIVSWETLSRIWNPMFALGVAIDEAAKVEATP